MVMVRMVMVIRVAMVAIRMVMVMIRMVIVVIRMVMRMIIKVEDGWKASKMLSRAQSSVTANYTVMCQSGPRRKYQGKLTLIKVQDEIVSDSRTELS